VISTITLRHLVATFCGITAVRWSSGDGTGCGNMTVLIVTLMHGRTQDKKVRLGHRLVKATILTRKPDLSPSSMRKIG
jgi:hypothetical protein